MRESEKMIDNLYMFHHFHKKQVGVMARYLVSQRLAHVSTPGEDYYLLNYMTNKHEYMTNIT